MDFIKTVESMESGKKVRRTDWGYSEKAYLVLLECNNASQFYLYSEAYNSNPEIPIGYGITYSDVVSEKWVEL